MAHRNHNKKVLIVDDSAFEREQVTHLLKSEWLGCEIRHAADGVEALAVVEQWTPDVVLTDLVMPRSGGLELVAALRKRQSLIPVVVVSGGGSEETAVEALQSGAASYIPKHNLPQLLTSTLETVLSLAATHSNRRRVISCLASMELRFDLENDISLVPPLVKYLEDHIGSLRLCDEHELIRIGMGLHESLTNAIHHGNLELDSELRQEEESVYYELAEARRVMWPYCDRKVQVLASLNGERVKFVIRDEGPGFNHRKVLDPTAVENIERIGGRGLLLIRSFMDDVFYNDRGNEITLIKFTSNGQKLLAKLGHESMPSISDSDPSFGTVVLLDEEAPVTCS